jgi:myo-inositol-1(or 4)-monophosphatase
MDLTRWGAVAEEAVLAGGVEIRKRLGTRPAGRAKFGADVVTEADLASEEYIMVVLRAAEPSFGLISEEAGAENPDAEYVWSIDPLDGTHNFLIGSPYVGVAVTLLHRGDPVVAVTHNPLTGTIWSATRDGGMFRDGQRVQVSRGSPTDRAVVAYAQGYAVSPRVSARMHEALLGQVKRVLTNWAPAVDWCLLADGGIDGIVIVDSEAWDQVGGVLMAREAGAIITDFAGRSAAPDAPRLIAAASCDVHQHLVSLLQGIDLGRARVR